MGSYSVPVEIYFVHKMKYKFCCSLISICVSESNPRIKWYQVSKWECNRADGRDLIREWKSAQESLGRKEAKYVATKEELAAVDAEKADSLLGR